MSDQKRAPLQGVKVLEISNVVLGPLACQMLGDLGADVIKVESPLGDSNRNLGPYKTTPGMSSMYLGCNRNKRSVVLDLKTVSGREAVHKLIETSDVLIHNFRPAAMQRLELDYQSVQSINPSLIYCAACGFSPRGPLAGKGALDDSIQAASGVAALQSNVEGEPRYMPTVLADKTTAQMVVQAVLAALFHRERTGEGQEVTVPMFETMVSFVMVEHLWGESFEPPLAKTGYPRVLSQYRRPYRCSDDLYLALLPYWDNHWNTFCELSGHTELKTDARFSTMRQRLENIDDTYRVTGEIVREQPRAYWLDLFTDTCVPTQAMNTLDDLLHDEHLRKSDFWHIEEHPTEGHLKMPRPPIEFSRTPASIRRAPPKMGEHTEEILREAGVDEAMLKQILAGDTT